jgi:hypothetical protein
MLFHSLLCYPAPVTSLQANVELRYYAFFTLLCRGRGLPLRSTFTDRFLPTDTILPTWHMWYKLGRDSSFRIPVSARPHKPSPSDRPRIYRPVYHNFTIRDQELNSFNISTLFAHGFAFKLRINYSRVVRIHQNEFRVVKTALRMIFSKQLLFSMIFSYLL